MQRWTIFPSTSMDLGYCKVSSVPCSTSLVCWHRACFKKGQIRASADSLSGTLLWGKIKGLLAKICLPKRSLHFQLGLRREITGINKSNSDLTRRTTINLKKHVEQRTPLVSRHLPLPISTCTQFASNRDGPTLLRR
jgi:hypothetical protein